MPSSSPSLPSSTHLNPTAKPWVSPPASTAASAAVLAFHRALPDYNETALRPLPGLSRALGLGAVLLKDESDRFGLPAFKILGASWAVHRAVSARLGIPEGAQTTPTQTIAARARAAGLAVLTCTDGNCGRAIARVARGRLGLPVRVYVPAFVGEATRARIRGEGGAGVEVEVLVVEGSYDDCVRVVREEARAREDAVLVLDVGFEGFEVVPTYFVQGYGTMLAESERQGLEATGGKPITHAIVPCGAGSIAEAVAAHFKSGERRRKLGDVTVIAVEPTAAACLHESMKAGRSVSVETGHTIMDGMNCGTLSSTAWPVLQAGLDASVVVTDLESHTAVEDLKNYGIFAGPCGAATVAALRRICADRRQDLGLDGDAVVVLYCTEGAREYKVPS
ncbi:tryptophan synthase beta subunit-like PLP-dependent enzyme [Biscogniauxia marginata]|nr:tryptophan synthase beta subunit-like PLP-dependent enzyme [Biscogniauxia marginata]